MEIKIKVLRKFESGALNGKMLDLGLKISFFLFLGIRTGVRRNSAIPQWLEIGKNNPLTSFQ